MAKLVATLWSLTVGLAFLPVHVLAALVARLRRRSRRGQPPRILWGPTPIHGTHYYSQACRRLGYESDTLMYGRYGISGALRFDHQPETLFPRLAKLPGFWQLGRHLAFLFALPRYDVHFHNFDGGLLQHTALWRLETALWHLGGATKVVYPYGGDAQVLSRLKETRIRAALAADYPQLARDEERIGRRVDHFCKHADFVYCSVEAPDYIPRWDRVIMQLSAVDTEKLDPARFKPGTVRSAHPGQVIVFHAPNHRRTKGTPYLEAAVEALKREGLPVELVILERRPNEEILQAIHDADIVVDQLLIGCYALFAIESMALGKPVVSYLRPDLKALYDRESWGLACPVVHASPETVVDVLRGLVRDAERRRRLGTAGREFVQTYHSLDAMGAFYDSVIRSVWPRRRHGKRPLEKPVDQPRRTGG